MLENEPTEATAVTTDGVNGVGGVLPVPCSICSTNSTGWIHEKSPHTRYLSIPTFALGGDLVN